jgi:hypothetical protein
MGKKTNIFAQNEILYHAGTINGYDLVEGPMADDTVWDYLEDYFFGRLNDEQFLILVKFKHPAHQVALCTEKALNKLEAVEDESSCSDIQDN